VIGATATPLRKGKQQKSLDDFYTDIVQEIDVPELIEMGYLATPRSFGIDIDMSDAKKKGDDWDMTSTYEKNKVYEGVVDNYARLTNGKKTIVFSSSIKSSKRLKDEFEMHGYPVKHIDAKSKNRDQILQWFKNTPDAILCNCGILTAGFDEPTIEVVILYRATSSLPLYLQMCGRGSRVTKTKNEFYILDFGNNVRRFGFWQDKRKWSIKKEEKKTNKDGVMAVRNCPSCGAMLPATKKVCSECGYKFSLKDAKDEDDKVRLIELLYSTGEVKQISQCTPMELYLLMLKKTLKAHYIYRVARSQGNDFLEQFTQVAGYSEGWLYRQKHEPKGFYDKKVKI
jgi:superfamily II DNA or RNA helicase